MREVRLQQPPSRIISLVPSITELLSDLGLDDSIAGITKFCIYPEHIFRTKTRVGGTKKVNIEKIKQLNPDLIIANKEENTKSDIETLEKEFPVWVSNVQSLDDAIEMIENIGSLTGKVSSAQFINNKIRSVFQKHKPLKEVSALYLIWKKPYMAAGGDTFINTMMNHCGFNNVISEKSRYPEISEEQMHTLNPEVVLLSSEPYPFSEKHLQEMRTLFSSSKIILVDGTYFSWYGSRLQHAPEYFNSVLDKFHFSNTKNTAV